MLLRPAIHKERKFVKRDPDDPAGVVSIEGKWGVINGYREGPLQGPKGAIGPKGASTTIQIATEASAEINYDTGAISLVIQYVGSKEAAELAAKLTQEAQKEGIAVKTLDHSGPGQTLKLRAKAPNIDTNIAKLTQVGEASEAIPTAMLLFVRQNKTAAQAIRSMQ